MQARDGNKAQTSNAPYELASSIASNDGTLNAIVNKSVRSVDVPLSNASAHEDEMLSWLHYPVEDPLDRGYCSDMFGDLPGSSAQVLRHSLHHQAGLRPQNAPFSSSTSIFSGMLPSHQNPGISSMDACTALSASTQDAAESCGSGLAEASCRVAGADAVAALGVYRAADFTTSHMGMEVYNKVDSEREVLSKLGSMGQPATHSSASANSMFDMQSERSQSLSQGSSQQQASFKGDVYASYPALKPLDFVNCYMPSVPTGKQMASNFTLFSRPAIELKANLHTVGESSGPTNIERVKQQMGIVQESTDIHTSQTAYMGAAQERWLLPPAPLPLSQPAYHSTSVGLEIAASVHPNRSPPLLPPPISDSEARERTNLSKDTMSNSRMSIMSSEKGLGTQEQTTTSPSRYSASSTERSGKVTDRSAEKKKAGVGEASNYQSEDASEMENVKKSCSNSKRMRTAEMHNQSERKRRVKINDKLKILQELIPNGNKPDKASLLDAVIEYVKLLQAQLQMMSMRTGAGIPSWMIPDVNMPHLQMSALPQMKLGTEMGMGVGVGMGMRMGMGVMDSNAAAMRAGCPLMPITMYPGQPPTGVSSHSSTSQAADQVHARGIVNSHNFYVAAPSHVQHLPMNLNVSQSIPMYSPYIAQPQLQMHPCPQPQQQQFQVQMQQQHSLPGNNGKKPVQ